MTVRNYTWLSANCLIKTSTFQLSYLMFGSNPSSFVDFSHKTLVFFLKLLLGQKIFYQQPFNTSSSTIIGFLPQSLAISLEGFLLVIWSFETYQLSYRAKIFSLVLRFSSLVLQWVKRLFIKLHLYLYLYTCWSLHSKKKIIIITWSCDLVIWYGT